LRNLLLYAAFLSGTVVIAQTNPFQNVQRSTGVVSVASGQSARLNIVYPTVPAPLLLVTCNAIMTVEDEDGGVLASKSVQQLIAGKSVSLDFNVDSTPHVGSIKIHGFSITTTGCHLLTTLEVIDNATQKTVLVVPSEVSYPFPTQTATQTQTVVQ